VKLRAVDYWVIGYSLFTSAVAFLCASDQAVYAGSHTLHIVAVVSALVAARFVPARGRYWPFLRYGYPVIFFTFFYADTVHYIFLIVDHWLDPALIHFEESLLGFNFTAWVAEFDSPLLLDFWMFGYAFYYILAPVAVTIMVWRNKPELFRRMNIAAAATFFVSYTMFYLFPLEGPRYAMVAVLPPLEGIVFYPLVMSIQNAGAIHGGCMPSSHTAVAWVVTYYLALVDRRLGAALVFISVLLSVGCFWGRFHYLTDVVVGLLIFAVAVGVTERYHRRTATGRHDAPTQEG
jgi:hypothetical protein